MSLTIVEAGEEDAPQAVAMERRAYAHSGSNTVLFPGPFPRHDDARIDSLTQRFKADPACRWLKVVDTSLPSEESMVSFAMWYFWQTPHDGPSTPPRAYGPGTNQDACEAFLGGLDQRRDVVMANRPYCYLKLMHTDPIHQSRGAASMLLRWDIDEAKRLGLPVFLEGAEAAQSFYDEFEFMTIKTTAVDLSPWGGDEVQVSMMIREPQIISSRVLDAPKSD